MYFHDTPLFKIFKNDLLFLLVIRFRCCLLNTTGHHFYNILYFLNNYIYRVRIESLEVAVREKDNELQSHKEKFVELKEHFKYNLKLLEERDRELEKYDAGYVGM